MDYAKVKFFILAQKLFRSPSDGLYEEQAARIVRRNFRNGFSEDQRTGAGDEM